MMSDPITSTGRRVAALHLLEDEEAVAIEQEAAATERERLRLTADEYARKSAPPHDSAWTLHEAWEWVRDVFLADPEAPTDE
jgi:hypothetical protein